MPYTGAFPIEQTIDHLGPMTRTVADAALMLGVLAGVDGLDPRQPTHDRADRLRRGTRRRRPRACGSAWSPRASARPVSDPGVDDSVRAAVERAARRRAATAEEISIPWHTDAMAVWNVIATEGAAFQMLDGNAYGMNSQGLYDPELIAHYAASRIAQRRRAVEDGQAGRAVRARTRSRSAAGSTTRWPATSRFELRKAYDDALSAYDVLVMPTLPYTAQEILALDAPLDDYLTTALSMIGNCAPFDVTGHPACSVPAGLVDGLPAGLMIVGGQFDDATVLRVAHTYEQAVGGFPAPPMPARAESSV